jgi:poly(hydroxyalkanoate) depolymerase family esterase
VIAFLRGRTSGSVIADTYQHYRFRLFVPSGYRPDRPAPLVVMLHGCTQDADDFAAGTGIDIVAAHATCLVLYPEQAPGANRRRCWNWFRPTNQMRGIGEPAAMISLIDHVAAQYAVDPERVYVAGLSAGACLAVTLGILYPERFAAVGVCAGMPYGAAQTPLGAMAAMQNGGSARSAAAAGLAALARERLPLPLIVFHGTADDVVHLDNSLQLTRQWAQIHSLTGTRAATLMPSEVRRHTPYRRRAYREELYRNTNNVVLIRRYIVEGMGHCWPGGTPEGSYTDSAGPPASRFMLRFFLGWRNPGERHGMEA